ncbi:alpha-ketoglutarate-dependent dioxygenase alkB homolog 7, mitochondrial [Procambarus clarkii]|uniref:alpha-ketoglutarate-dependent dioxygenase alkB homolog 7, mitochondrial n=1 Tax=Procambarus clarkii TaxID=6728 RepID=UPI003744A77E
MSHTITTACQRIYRNWANGTTMNNYLYTQINNFILKPPKASGLESVTYAGRFYSIHSMSLSKHSHKIGNHLIFRSGYAHTVLNTYCDIRFLSSFESSIMHGRTVPEQKMKSSRNCQEQMLKSSTEEPNYFYFHPLCQPEMRMRVVSSFDVVRDFINEEEEEILMKEVEPHLKRMKYEFDHWDDAIHGFRETERSRWGKAATIVVSRMRQYAFPAEDQQLPQIHVLDLAKAGVIKPHVDSVRFCGNIICGLCLLSDAVMRLVHVDNKDQVVDILLRRRSLYVMKDESRYNYTHEVLGEKDSYFGTESISRERRISIICRNHPREDGS